jgi:hypothetical protein
MAEHPEVFISATTRDLASYRREVKDALLSLQIFPIEESRFTLAYGSLTEMLCALISRCDAVIHLAGFSYRAPAARSGSAAPPYTQWEYDVARELGKPLYLFLASEVGFLRRARKNGRCSLPIGTPLSGARTSITPLPSGRIFAAGCANCACPP